MFSGEKDLGEICIGYENIPVDAVVKNLTVPEGAKSALAVFIADSTDTDLINAYFSNFAGVVSVVGEGLPLNTLANLVIREGCLNTFEIVSANAFTHSLRVEYYA